ncbi:hypothetical protein [Agrobacterium rosae]|uniref:Uncharacterized protein n=1 Tax=Agrobacterium rosae TaxID=1972867 RepID=A0AAW9FF18_9HYPH|nr:hypothetical protein [Agrobacterium rosae]MDX8301209.1 hypothetical protein [Agrobacterium rosae]
MQVYQHSDLYHDVLDNLEAHVRNFDPASPDDLRTHLIMILGEIGGIWPISCFTGHDEGEVIVAG